MDSETRDRLFSQLKTWIDELPEGENLPEGFPLDELAAAPQPDLLTIVSAVSGLSEEFRVQGKHFKKLQEELQKRPEPVPPKPSAPVAEILEAGREEGRAEVLAEMMETHNRLCRVLDESQKKLDQSGVLSSWFGQNQVQQALVDGLKMSLARVEEFLVKHGIARFGGVGETFDPNCMKAVDAVVTPGKAPGAILGVIHYGYRRHGKVMRTAEVLVSK